MLGFVAPLLKLLQEGSQQNWWGFYCPAHCQGPGLGALFAAYLLGILSAFFGLASYWYLLWCPARGVQLEPSRAVISSGARQRLRAYSYEH